MKDAKTMTEARTCLTCGSDVYDEEAIIDELGDAFCCGACLREELRFRLAEGAMDRDCDR